MDRLVKVDVTGIEINFKKGQKSNTTFRITNLMHTMSVAIYLNTSNPGIYSFTQTFSIIPPLSTSSYTLIFSQQSDHDPPLISPYDAVTVKSSMLPTGKANQDELRRLFSRPGPHVFRDAVIPINIVGPQVIDFLITNHAKVADVALFFKKAISGCSDSQLTSLLQYAVISGIPRLRMIGGLIDSGADVKHKDENGRSFISLAVEVGSIDLIKLLILSGCRIDNSVDRVLHYAAAINRVDIMELLYMKFGYPVPIDVNSVDEEGRNPIHIAAANNYANVIEFCVSVRGNTDALDSNGCSPLHIASEKGHLESVTCLLNHSNFGKYQLNKEGKTAFTIAAENGHTHLYDILQLGDVLMRAARLDDVKGIRSCLAEGGSVNEKDQNGWTPLHRAAFKGRVESVKALLDNGAEVDEVDDEGFTPLHCSVEAGHVQVAILLIARGASIKSIAGVIPWNLDTTVGKIPRLGCEKRKEIDRHIEEMINNTTSLSL
ncbi:hypothetical protein ACFE04_018941 [Oxalis oulophora]